MVKIEALAEAALQHESLRLRSLAQELLQTDLALTSVSRPQTEDRRLLALATGLLELLALHTNQATPTWTDEIGGSPKPIFLLQAAMHMKRLRELCERESPEPLRKRNLYAPPDFLTFA